ncbi:PREDICTED: histone-lysine N-methyltransferase, H3 lysine-79 specific-like [Amphimedon queenslandica]|uniref:Uncharacterized protein n=1 Tax=Amphimedon queenslandica TaxID=400682 RepID=A0A1X7UGA4_AMPQE|nr:PREDICTED: histone-lysine N-methyltransferase, H3 lysine-79 specific-like [Amphimedon queenslandica]|eukprot:XP_019854427.1 PREDICTED: histone-lysine N-methyltransferase, H3 lysine-79 specific-like [Amphimedon queenslandica]
MASLQASQDCCSRVRKIIRDILERQNHTLSEIVGVNSLPTFTRLMRSKRLITVDVTRIDQSGQFEAIMHDYRAVIPLKQDMESLESHCKMLLEILEELEGPAIEAAKVLCCELRKEVKEATGIAFLSDNSELHPSIPPQGKRSNSESAIPQEDINHLHEKIERSRSDDHLDHRKKQPISKLTSVTEESPGASSSNTGTHSSDIKGSNLIRPSSLTTCEKEVTAETAVADSGVISFPASSPGQPPSSQQYDAISSPEAPNDYTIHEPVNNTENATSNLHVMVPGTVSSNGEATNTNAPSDRGDEPNHKQPTQSTEEDQSHVIVLTNSKSVNPTCQIQLEKTEPDSTESSYSHAEEIRDKNRQIKKLENDCRQIEEELELIKNEKATLVKSKDDHILRIRKELEAAKRAYESDIKKTVERMKAKSDQKIKEIEEKLEEKNEKFQEAKAKLQEAKKELMETKEEKEKELQEVKNEFKEYKEEKRSELSAAKSEHKKEKEELKCELQEKKEEMKEIKKEKSDEIKEIKKEKKEELEELNTELSETKKQLQEAKQEIKRLKKKEKELEEKEKELEEKKKELEEKDEELEKIKKELKNAKHQLEESQKGKEDS